jgi:hypothetical protein
LTTTALDRAEDRIGVKKPPKYARVPLSELFIDPGYQREIIPTHLEKIRKDFDVSQLDVLHVSKRDNGQHAVFDGQHRYLILEERPDWDWAPCLVHTGLTPQEEADLFRALQDNRRPLTPIDKFKARVFGEEPVAVGIKAITDKLGFEIGIGPKSLQAVVVVERVYRRGNLEETLKMLGIWRGDAKWLEGSLIDGLSRFLDLYPDADRNRARLMWSEMSPTIILRRSAEFMASAHSSKAYGCLEVLRDAYKSKQFKLPTVADAMAERKATTGGEGGTRYRRLTGEEVRDAIVRLHEKKVAAGIDPPRWTIPELQEELGGVSRASLTKRQKGFIDQFIDRKMLVRYRSGGNGPFLYEYIPPHKQQRMSQRQSGGSNGGGPRVAAHKAVQGTGKPKRRPGTRDIQRTGRR